MQIAVGSLARARAALRWTVDYVRERTAFGKPIGALQNTRFALADVATEVSVAEAFIDRCVHRTQRRRLSPADAAKAKLWATEMEFRCLDGCQQLFGGYGYMREYPDRPRPRSTRESPVSTVVRRRSCARSSAAILHLDPTLRAVDVTSTT